MSYEERVSPITMVAGFDASTQKPAFVITGSDGKAELCGLNGRATGILAGNAPENHPVRVGIGGILPVEVGSGGLTAGGYVKSDATGKAIAQDSTNPRLGTVQSSADGGKTTWAAGEFAPILFQPVP